MFKLNAQDFNLHEKVVLLSVVYNSKILLTIFLQMKILCIAKLNYIFKINCLSPIKVT